MTELSTICSYFEDIEAANGMNSKKELLAAALREPDTREVLSWAFTNDVYGVSTRSFEKITNYDLQRHGIFFDGGELVKYFASEVTSWKVGQAREFLDKLKSLSGNSQLDHLKILLQLSKLEAKWLTRIILKDLKFGISFLTINKVLASLFLPKFEKHQVQLCGKFDSPDDPEIARLVGFPLLATIKYDGERGFLYKKGNNVRFVSRQGKIIDYVPELMEGFKSLSHDFVLDGEILCKDFSTLQKRIGRLQENLEPIKDLHFRVFDILSFNDISLIEKTQEERTKELPKLLKETNFLKLEENKIIHNKRELEDFYKEVIKRKEEGIILKKLSAPYEFNSRKNWYKIKPVYENTFKVFDWKKGTGKNSAFIATLFVQDASGLIKSGVGSGLTENDMIMILDLERQGKLQGLCLDVRYNEITKNKEGQFSLRHPRVLKLRFDKTKADDLSLHIK